MYKNVLWIDPAVRDYQVFVDSVNADTLALVYPAELRFDVERIGFVFEKHGPMAAYLQANATLLIEAGVKHMDFLACDTLPEWQSYYDRLTGITVGASNNQTGNLQYGGDWLMESTCEDVEIIYFTHSIQYYQYLLGLALHTMVIDSSRNVWTCGWNTFGQLGRGTRGVNETKFDRVNISNIIAISAGQSHSMALDSSRNVWTCGSNSNGQLGRDGAQTNFGSVNISNIIAISAGSDHSLVLDSSRNVWTCGSNSNGQLGRDGVKTKFDCVNISNIIAISAGYQHSIVLDSSRNVWTCGRNNEGQLGRVWTGNAMNFSKTDLSNIIAISAGYQHSMVLDSSRNVWTCGNNSNGQLGRVWTGNAINFSKTDLSNIIAISAGLLHSMALDSSRNVWTCGRNDEGQLGRDGDKSNFSCVNISNIVEISAGYYHSMALDSSRNVWTCGWNGEGQLGRNEDRTSFTKFGIVTDLSNILTLSKLDLPITLSTTFEPSSAPSKTTLTLYGDNFLNITSVQFGTVDASFTWNSSTKVTVKVPDAIPLSSSIFITDATGTMYTYPDNFTNVTFTVTTFTPSSSLPDGVIFLNGANFSNISAVLFGTVPSVFLLNSSINLSVQVPVNVDNDSIQVYDIYGNNRRYATNFTYMDYYATCFFGYFKPTVAGLHQFNVSSDHLVQLRLGDKTLYDLRTQGSIVTINASTISRTNVAIQLNASYYPLVMTYVNTYSSLNPSVTIRNNISFGGTAKALLPYCTLDKAASGLYAYSLYGDQLRQTMYDITEMSYNASTLDRMDRIYSPTWAFGTLPLQTYWNDPSTLPLVEGPVDLLSLNISSIQLANQILTIQGTGLHANVSVFLDNIHRASLINANEINVSVTANFSSVRLTDGFAKSNVYSIFSVTSINMSTAIRNSSVNVSGSNFSTVASITIGGANASFALFTNKVEVRIPESTQTQQPFMLYDGSGSSVLVTEFTIPPLFTITGFTPSSAAQNASMTLTGTNFSNLSYVFVGTTKIPINQFTTNRVNVSIPTGVGNVSVTVVDIYNNRNFIDGFILYGKLNVSTITPSPAVRGTPITITGSQFYDISYVNVGGTKVYNVSYNTTTIQFDQPLFTAGNVSVGVYDLYNNASISFVVQKLFSVSSYTPSSVIPQRVLQIRGSNFSNLSHVLFGTTAVVPITYTDVSLNVSVPTGLADNVSVTVVDLFQNSSSISNLSILNLKFTSVTPAVAVEGTPLMIAGDNLSNISFVLFGNVSNTPTTVTKTSVQVTVPVGVTTITTMTLLDVYDNRLVTPFTSATLFSVSGFNPSSLKPQRVLQITGLNFSNMSYVKFDTKTVQPFQSTQSTLQVTLPTGLPANVSVTVYNRFEKGIFVGNLSVLNLYPVTITPTSAVRGTPLTLIGSNFHDLSYINLGSKISLPNFSYTDTQITFDTPNTVPGNVSIGIFDLYGNNASLSFTVNTLFSLSSYSLSSVIPQTALQIKGSNFSNMSHVLFGTTPVKPFDFATSYVNVSVPTGLANNVSVTLYDLFGNTSSLANLSILNLSIASIQPSRAVQRVPLTITGAHLSNASYVLFGTFQQPIVSRAPTTVVVNVPDDVNPEYVTLYDIYNNNVSVAFTVAPLFSLTGFTPTSLVPNAPLQITGDNFVNLSSIQFGDVSTREFTYNKTNINVSIPTNSIGNVSITVYDEYTNVKTITGLNLSAKLSLASIHPTSAVKGTPLTLTGNHFYNLSYIQLAGTKLYSPNFSYSVTQITFTQPALLLGTTSIVVGDLYGNNSALSFTVNPLFSLSSYNLSSVIPQTALQIRGSNFSNMSHVLFGTTPIKPFDVATTYVNVSVPTGLANNVSVTLYDLFGNTSSLANLSILNLSIASIQPSRAVQRAPLTITGAHLSNASYVLFGTFQQPILSRASTTVVVNVPDDVNPEYVTLYDIYNNNVSVSFTVAPLFSLTSFTPTSLVPNAPLRIAGDNFANLSSIQFGNVSTREFNYTATNINVSIPTNSIGNVSITVYDEYRNVKTILGLNISAKPTITSITATAVQGAPVMVTGNDFYEVAYIQIGQAVITNFSYTLTTVRFTQPLYASANVSVTLVDPYGNNASTSFLVQPLFSVTGYNPSQVIPQRVLQIKGSNFSNLSYVRFGTLPIYPISYDSQQVNVSVPTGLANNVSVTVVDVYGNSSSIARNLNVLNLQIDSISPAIAVEGTPLTLRGNNLSYINKVRFGNVSTVPSTQSRTTVQVTVPTGVSLIDSITIEDLYGNSLLAGFNTATLFSLTRYNSSSVTPQTTLQIVGTNFSNMSYVKFGTKEVQHVQYSDTILEVTVPTGLPSTVPVTVYNQFSTGLSLPNLSILNLSLTSVTPTAVQEAPLTITGENLLNLSFVDFGTIRLTLPHPRITYTSTTLRLKIPPYAPGNISIVVGDLYGNNVSTVFTVATLFAITYFTPDRRVPRAPLQILGTNLSNLSYVQVGEEKVSTFTYDSEKIDLTVPLLSASNVSVTVVDVYQNRSEIVTPFTVLPTLSVSTFQPTEATRGTPLTFTGANFSNLYSIDFKNETGQITSFPLTTYTNTSFLLTIPEFTGVLEIRVKDVYGNESIYPQAFTYYPPFVLSTMTLSSAQRSRISLKGSRFYNLDRIEFGNLSTRNFSNTSSEIQVIVPDSSKTNCSVTVYDLFGNTASYPNFSYTNPFLDALSYEGQTNMPFSITGKYLLDTSYVMLGTRVEPTLRQADRVSFTIPSGGGTSITTYDIYNTSVTVPFAYRNISAFSVSPAAATKNWILTIAGENLTRVTEVYMKGVLVTSTKTDTALSFPAIPGEGNASIYLKDAYGNVTRVDTFQYKNPTVTRFNLSRGRTRQVITIQGTHLENSDYVLFGNVRNLDNLERYNTSLKVVVPENNGNVSVFVVDICGNSILCPDPFLCMGGNASIFGVSPTKGTRNTSVVILGENLGYSALVKFGTQTTTINKNTSTYVNVSAPLGDNPPGLTGVNITVTDITDETVVYSYGNFTYENPVILRTEPSEGPIGIPVMLQGQFLNTTTFLSFHNSSLSYERSANIVSFVVPDGSMNAPIYLLDALGNQTNGSTFVYRNPRIDSIHPSRGPPHAPVEIRGIHLLNSSFLSFGNTSVTILSRTETSVFAKIPPGQDNVSVYLRDRYGNKNETTFTYQYPTVTLMTPVIGPPKRYVDLSGQYLENMSTVTFRNMSSTIEVINSQLVRMKVPENADGIAQVVAYDRYDNPVTLPDYTYQNPILRNLNLYSNVSGSTLTLTGSYLYNTSSIWMGPYRVQNFSYNVSFYVETLQLTVPPGTGNVSITAYDIYNNSASIQTFSYIYPRIRSIDPSACVIQREVILQGDYLQDTRELFFGNSSTPFTYGNGSIRVKVPPGTGNVSVTAYDPYRNPASISFKYLFPTIRTQPSSGPALQSIRLIGENLENTSYIEFGNTSTREFTYANGSLRMTVPDGSGTYVVTAYDIYQNRAVSSYTYVRSSLRTISPTSSLPGVTLVLTGDSLSYTSYLTFRTANYVNVSVVPTYVGEQLRCIAPILYGPLTVKAYDIYGNDSTEGLFIGLDPATYEFRLDQMSNSGDGKSGPIGSELYLSGTNFLNITHIRFGDMEASFKVLSNNLIRIIVPPIAMASMITLESLYSQYPVDIFTPTFSQITTESLTGSIYQTLQIEGTHLEVVAVEFSTNPVSMFSRSMAPMEKIDAPLVSSTPTLVEFIVPYGYENRTIYFYDIRGESITVPFEYIPQEIVRLDTRNTSGITQDAVRDLYQWTPSRVDYPTGSYLPPSPIQRLVVDTHTLYTSNGTTQITRFRTDSKVTLRPFSTQAPITHLFLYSNKLYLISGLTLYVCDVTLGRIVTYLTPRIYIGFAFWKDQVYGTDGTEVYQVTLATVVSDDLFGIEVIGPIKQILVANDRLFILSDQLIQYNLTGKIELTLEVDYTCMAYSRTSLLLSNNQWIDQILLPPPIQPEIRWESCTPTEGTQHTLVKMTGENLNQITTLLFDKTPATILMSTISTLLFRVPKGRGAPKIYLLNSDNIRIDHTFTFLYKNTEFTCSLPREGRPGTPIYLFGDNLDQVKHVYLGGSLVAHSFVRKNTLRLIAPDLTGIQTFSLIDKENNTLTPGLTYSYITTHSSICFPGDTLIYADQGTFEIRKLIPGTHTIYGKDIVAITVTHYIEDTMVCVEPGAMASHSPTIRTIMSNKHKVFVHGKMVEAGRLVGRPGITSIPYDGNRVYNVLLTTEGRMNVQGMICETLDPSNPMAALFTPEPLNEMNINNLLQST